MITSTNPVTPPDLVDRIRELVAACGPASSRNDRAIIAIVYCISEGIDAKDHIVKSLKRAALRPATPRSSSTTARALFQNPTTGVSAPTVGTASTKMRRSAASSTPGVTVTGMPARESLVDRDVARSRRSQARERLTGAKHQPLH